MTLRHNGLDGAADRGACADAYGDGISLAGSLRGRHGRSARLRLRAVVTALSASVRAPAIVAAMLCVVAMAVVACGDSGDTTVENCPAIGPSMETPVGPPALPYLFTGTLYVDGEPAPEGERVWVQMVQSWSAPTLTGPDGSFRNLIHGPVYAADFESPFYFCVGERDGNSVKADLTVDYEDMGSFFYVDDLRVEVPHVP